MKKRVLVLALLSVFFAVSNVSAALVSGRFNDIDSCQVIYHDGSADFTFGDPAKKLTNYKGYELRCQVHLLYHKDATTVSLPVILSDFSPEVQKALTPTVSITKPSQIEGSLGIAKEELVFQRKKGSDKIYTEIIEG